MKRWMAGVALFTVLIGVGAWSPWVTDAFAKERVVNAFQAAYSHVADGCGFNCRGCGANTTRRAPFGRIVQAEYACGLIPADLPQYHQRQEFFVSLAGTVHRLTPASPTAPGTPAAPVPADRGVVYQQDGRLVRKSGGTVVNLVALADLPKMALPYGAQPGQEFGVGRDGFGPFALRPGKLEVAFTTRGLHPLLAVYSEKDAKLTPLDLWFESGPGEMAWSPDGRYLAVTVKRPSGGTELQVWEPDVKKKLSLTGIPAGPDVTVAHLRWTGQTLTADMNGKSWALAFTTN